MLSRIYLPFAIDLNSTKYALYFFLILMGVGRRHFPSEMLRGALFVQSTTPTVFIPLYSNFA